MYAQSFYASSDERLKTEIQTIEIENDVPEPLAPVVPAVPVKDGVVAPVVPAVPVNEGWVASVLPAVPVNEGWVAPVLPVALVVDPENV